MFFFSIIAQEFRVLYLSNLSNRIFSLIHWEYKYNLRTLQEKVHLYKGKGICSIIRSRFRIKLQCNEMKIILVFSPSTAQNVPGFLWPYS